MLSKKQFNAAAARLQKSLTTSDLFQMLRYQLTQTDKDRNTEIIAQLDVLSDGFKDTTWLDRRRAENYLANSLYGKNHSQIAHLLDGNKQITDEEFGYRAEMYGKFIKFWGGPLSVGDDPLVEDHKKNLAKKLRATSPESLKVSYQGYNYAAEEFEHIHQYNVLMYVSLLDLDIEIELIFTRDESPDEIEPIEDVFISVSVNGMDLEQYGKKIGLLHSDKAIHYSTIWSLETLFSGVAFELVTKDESGLNDFYCLDYPEKMMKKHQWRLSRDRKYIAETLVKNHSLWSISSSISDVKNVKFSKRLKNLMKAISEASHIDSYKNVSLMLKGFSQENSTDEDIISGEITLIIPKFDATIVIRVSYDNDDTDKEITNLEIIINGEFIESCSDGKKIKNTKYAWWYVAYRLRNTIPMINSLLIK